MSKARTKGSGWETELEPLMRYVFGEQMTRAPLRGINDMGDFDGMPGLVLEAKKTDVPHFLLWAKVCQKKSPHWRIFWSGDRRRGDGPFVMMPLKDWADLEYKARRWDEHNGLLETA